MDIELKPYGCIVKKAIQGLPFLEEVFDLLP